MGLVDEKARTWIYDDINIGLFNLVFCCFDEKVLLPRDNISQSIRTIRKIIYSNALGYDIMSPHTIHDLNGTFFL